MLEQLVGYVLAALMVGLWWGERGRRKSVERLLVTGMPDTGLPPAAVSRVPTEAAEDRWRRETQLYTEEAVERGVQQLLDDAKAAGITVDPKELRRDVERMLSGEDVTE